MPKKSKSLSIFTIKILGGLYASRHSLITRRNFIPRYRLLAISTKPQKLLSVRFENAKFNPESRALLVEHAKKTEALEQNILVKERLPLLVDENDRGNSLLTFLIYIPDSKLMLFLSFF